jgi:hypothetical protein
LAVFGAAAAAFISFGGGGLAFETTVAPGALFVVDPIVPCCIRNTSLCSAAELPRV